MTVDITSEPVPVPVDAVVVAERLRAALTAAGFDVECDFERVRADVTVSGQGFVTVGRLAVGTAVRLCEVVECAAAGRSAWSERGARA